MQMTEAQKKAWYDRLVQSFVRPRYSETDELKVMREYLRNPEHPVCKENFETYHAYIETCKTKAKQAVYGNEEE